VGWYITMTPEEKVEQEVWFVLQKIKTCLLRSGKDGVITYWIKSPPDLKAEGMPFPVEESEIVGKLEGWKAVKRISPDDIGEVSESENALSRGQSVFTVIMHLKVLQPKFEQLYKEYQLKHLPEENKVKSHSTDSGYIEKITCVEQKDESRYKIIINDVSKDTIKVNGKKNVWGLLLAVAKGEKPRYEDNKSSFDFLNSNENCQIYTKLGFKVTKILKTEEGTIVKNIPIEPITEKALLHRINKNVA